MFADDWLDKEENGVVADLLFKWLARSDEAPSLVAAAGGAKSERAAPAKVRGGKHGRQAAPPPSAAARSTKTERRDRTAAVSSGTGSRRRTAGMDSSRAGRGAVRRADSSRAAPSDAWIVRGRVAAPDRGATRG